MGLSRRYKFTKILEKYIKQIGTVDVPIVLFQHLQTKNFKAIETAVNVYKNRSKNKPVVK